MPLPYSELLREIYPRACEPGAYRWLQGPHYSSSWGCVYCETHAQIRAVKVVKK